MVHALQVTDVVLDRGPDQIESLAGIADLGVHLHILYYRHPAFGAAPRAGVATLALVASGMWSLQHHHGRKSVGYLPGFGHK